MNTETIAIHMITAHLPLEWVLRVLNLAQKRKAVAGLMRMWHEASDEEKAEYEASIQECLEDEEMVEMKVTINSSASLSTEVKERRDFKKHLRDLIDLHGGVSAIAEKAAMPQPSLSRLLNGGHRPRKSTLLRIAQAMGVDISILEPTSNFIKHYTPPPSQKRWSDINNPHTLNDQTSLYIAN